jgi:hypothetical protein
MAKQQSQRGGGQENPIQASLTTAQTHRLGDPIEVTLTVRNTSGTAYQLLIWETPFENEVSDFLVVERDERPLRYDGIHMKRGDPAESEYLLLAPGETVTRAVDISRSYPINTPGVYRATLRITFFDAFAVPTAVKQPPRLRAQHQPLEVPPVSVQFTVVPDRQPKPTDGHTVRSKLQADKQAKEKAQFKAKDPTITGGTTTQQDDTRIAHQNAQHFAALAAQQLSSTAGASNTLYSDWFGTFDQGRYDTVTDHYSDISKVLETESVTYDFTGDQCTSSTFAYTYSGSRTVWLCGQYISAPQIGTDCKFGTLVHEWSHAVSDTNDYVYGETNAGNLANTDPAKAIDNADNHEYFTEHLAEDSDFGKILTFITDRSQFGKDEVDARLAAASPAVIDAAFYVHADGFWPDKLGITATSLGTSPNVKPTLSMNPSVTGMTVDVASLDAEDTTLPIAPQRFTWTLRVKFTSSTGFPNVPNAEQIVTLTATLAGLSASAQIRLVKEASPYEVDGPVSWLSTDVRVFQIAAGESRFGATMGSTPAAASTYVKQVIANLDSGNNGGQTFDTISTDQQTSALELSQQVNGVNVYNFAVAKVRYVGTLAISNVRAFFRLFPVSTTSTEFEANTTYRRATQGTTTIPLLGISGGGDLVSIPCFAEQRVDSATTLLSQQTDPANVKPSMAASPPLGETVAHFGAWLDINQTQPQFPNKPAPADGPWSSGRKTVQELIKNAHQCLVAEIAYDPDPIANGATPGGSDKLAQRNLSIVTSANPGDEASHRIPNVFELWPAPKATTTPGEHDELLIDWGNVPAGTTATIFIPEIDAAQIVALARAPGRGSTITQVDGTTIAMATGGISYLALPPGAIFGLTGLLTIDLPASVSKGQHYTVVVRQITDAVAPPPPPVITKTVGVLAVNTAAVAITVPPLKWRRVAGSYEISIPVRTKEVMLAPEIRLLSVLKWILQSMSTSERWYPVFSRYVGVIADRVDALGGDSRGVDGSPQGDGGRGDQGDHGDGHDGDAHPGEVPECAPIRGPVCRYEGKVTGLIYDCFGDFEGFLLDVCGKEFRFFAREHEIEALVEQAWRQRIAIAVVVRIADKRRAISIILRRAPEPFQS